MMSTKTSENKRRNKTNESMLPEVQQSNFNFDEYENEDLKDVMMEKELPTLTVAKPPRRKAESDSMLTLKQHQKYQMMNIKHQRRADFLSLFEDD